MTEKIYSPGDDRNAVNRLVDGLNLFDDDLMSRVFDKNNEVQGNSERAYITDPIQE